MSDAVIVAECLKNFQKNLVEQQIVLERNANDHVSELKISSNIGSPTASQLFCRVLSSNSDIDKITTAGVGISDVQKYRKQFLSTARR